MKKNYHHRCLFGFYTFLLWHLQICSPYGSGKYPYAERYELNISDSDLIKKINEFKINSPQMIPPGSIGLKAGKASNNDLWYHVYFYYPHENEILYASVRGNGKGSTFALVSICEGTNIYNNSRIDINIDFTDSENTAQKKKFEERILHKLK